jgi:hypothetical protein
MEGMEGIDIEEMDCDTYNNFQVFLLDGSQPGSNSKENLTFIKSLWIA